MEHSLHRVSLGSRRAHPGLSFYLTTFGKCPLQPGARAAAPCSQRPERAPHGDGRGWEQAILPFGCTFSDPFLLWVPRRGSGTGSGLANRWAPPAAWSLVPSAFGSASLGWNNYAPVNLSETQVVTTEFPIRKQLTV